jgi:hypothetical protein
MLILRSRRRNRRMIRRRRMRRRRRRRITNLAEYERTAQDERSGHFSHRANRHL